MNIVSNNSSVSVLQKKQTKFPNITSLNLNLQQFYFVHCKTSFLRRDIALKNAWNVYLTY